MAIKQYGEKKKREKRPHFIKMNETISEADKQLLQQELNRIKEGRRKEREEMENG